MSKIIEITVHASMLTMVEIIFYLSLVNQFPNSYKLYGFMEKIRKKAIGIVKTKQ